MTLNDAVDTCVTQIFPCKGIELLASQLVFDESGKSTPKALMASSTTFSCKNDVTTKHRLGDLEVCLVAALKLFNLNVEPTVCISS